MDIQIRVYEGYKAEEIVPLYEAVGWTNYTDRPQMLEQAFQNSLRVYGAYEQDRLIGLIRVVGDGHSVILIQDIIVHPDRQRRGIGSTLIRKVLQEYKVYQTHLFTDDTEKTIAFYQSMGFRMVKDLGCCGFSIYRT